MNTVNLSQRTNIQAGSPDLDLSTLMIQHISIPGISFSHPEIGGRNGTRLTLNADTMTFNELSFDVIVDEDLLVYNELMGIITSQLDIETGVYTQKTFEFWVTVTDSFGNEAMRWDFHNCKIESLGDLDYDYSDESTEYLLNLTLKYDYFTFKHFKVPSSLPSLQV